MTKPPDDFSETAQEKLENAAQMAQEKAQNALEAGKSYVRENPFPIILGAFILGTILGIAVSQREPRPRETKEKVRELADDIVSQITDRLPDFKKLRGAYLNSPFVEQAQEVGKKLKWW
ncbi:hypothetical protein BH09VER1_BH09VER1_35090 [soil metagenome]